jgi:hypothetical protein
MKKEEGRMKDAPVGLECGDMSPLFNDATCRVEPKRGHVRALQNRPLLEAPFPSAVHAAADKFR